MSWYFTFQLTLTPLQDMPQDLNLAVQECLNLMTTAYKGVKGQSALIVEALILENIYSVRDLNCSLG